MLNTAHPDLQYFFAHIHVIEILAPALALALALLKYPQVHPDVRTPPFLLLLLLGTRSFWTSF